MSKRELSHNEEEKLPGNNPVKKVKGSPNQDLSNNNSLSPSKQRHTQTTNFFRINSVSNKPSQDTDDESEFTITTEKHSKIPEIVLDSDSDVSYYSQDEENEAPPASNQKINLKKMPNVMFYLNMLSSQPQGDFIENIHKYWKNDYKKLEIHHGYVQWLFPNFYSAGFNKDAFRLNANEARLFRENKEIAERLVKSYELILGFFGVKLANKKTGQLQRAHNFEERYRTTMLLNTQNHVRVRRILAHLNVVGLRRYAIQFVKFFETEIYGEEGGYQIHKEQAKPLKSDYLLRLRSNPLFPLIKYDVFKDWRVYGEVNTPEEVELLHQNCYTNDEKDFEASILFKY